MTNGSDPALWLDSPYTICMLVPDELSAPTEESGAIKGVDAVAIATLKQIYGPTGWTLVPVTDPRFVLGVDKAVEDPSLTLVTRETGVVYVRRAQPIAGETADPRPLVRHVRFALLDPETVGGKSAVRGLKKNAIPAARSVEGPSPSRLGETFESGGAVTRATAKASTTKKRGKR